MKIPLEQLTKASDAIEGSDTRIDAYFRPDQDAELLRLARVGWVVVQAAEKIYFNELINASETRH